MGERVGGRAWRVFLSLPAPGSGRPATPRGQSPGSPVSTGASRVPRSRARSPARGPRLHGPPLPEGRRSAAERDAVTSWRAASSFTDDTGPRPSRRSTQPCSSCACATPIAASRRAGRNPVLRPRLSAGTRAGPISGPITDGEEEHPSSGTQSAEYSRLLNQASSALCERRSASSARLKMLGAWLARPSRDGFARAHVSVRSFRSGHGGTCG